MAIPLPKAKCRLNEQQSTVGFKMNSILVRKLTVCMHIYILNFVGKRCTEFFTMKNNNKSYKYDMKEMYKHSDLANVTNNRLDLNVFTQRPHIMK